MSIDRRMDKYVVHVYTREYYSIIQKNNAICNSSYMGLRVSEWVKSDRGEMPWSIYYIQNLKRNDTKRAYLKRKEIHRLRKQLMVAGVGEGITREFGRGHIHTAIFKMDNYQGPIV